MDYIEQAENEGREEEPENGTDSMAPIAIDLDRLGYITGRKVA